MSRRRADCRRESCHTLYTHCEKAEPPRGHSASCIVTAASMALRIVLGGLSAAATQSLRRQVRLLLLSA